MRNLAPSLPVASTEPVGSSVFRSEILPADSLLLNGDRESLEATLAPYGMKLYGRLPAFGERARHVAELVRDVEFLKPMELSLEEKESLLFYRLKFGESIVHLITRVLENYPQISLEPGKIIYVVGLPGAGKSLALEAISQVHGAKVAVMDGDTTRLNLLARKVMDIELAHGTSMAEVKGLMHTAVSWACNIAVHAISSEMKKRGYVALQWSAFPPAAGDVDRIYYIAHRLVRMGDLPMHDPSDADCVAAYDTAADRILRVTNKRAEAGDSFDWERCEPVYRFSEMEGNNFTRIPKSVVVWFLTKMKDFVENTPDLLTIENPEGDLETARENLVRLVRL